MRSSTAAMAAAGALRLTGLPGMQIINF